MDFALKLQERTGKGYLSYSSLKYALQDMRLFEMYMAGQLRKESDALTFGSLYDDLLFSSSEDVESKYIVLDDAQILEEIGGASPRSTKKYKEWLAELSDSNVGKKIVKAEDYDMAIDMINRLQDCGIAETYLEGEYQVEFNKFIDAVLSGLSIGKDEIVLLKFKNIINGYLANNDHRKLDSEVLFVRKKIDESVREIQQLENNLSFFSNASDDNPLVKSVRKNINDFKLGLDIWRNKLAYLRSLEY